MSVHVLYKGGLGNDLFEYICARLFAERHGLKLVTPWVWPAFVEMSPHKPGASVQMSEHLRIVTDKDWPLDQPTWPRGRYVFEGYFQKASWYHDNRDRILSFAKPKMTAEADPDAIVLNVRLGSEYRRLGWVIDASWYKNILSSEKFSSLIITTDIHDDPYLAAFAKWNPTVVGGDQEEDWAVVLGAKKLICSNSTFGWWGAYFGKAEKIYTFPRWVPHPDVKLGLFPGRGIEVNGLFAGEAK